MRRANLDPIPRILAVGLAAALGGAVIADISKRPQPESHAARLARQYDVNQLRSIGRSSFDFLVHLAPANVRSSDNLAKKMKLANTISSDTAYFTLSLLATGQNFGNHIDEMDLARQVIPRSTQTALGKADIRFTPLVPPACDIANGNSATSIDPYDYSNHGPADVKVRAVKRSGHEVVEIPLGIAQQPMPEPSIPASVLAADAARDLALDLEDPLDPINGPAINPLPCNLFPQIGSPGPNGQLRPFELY